MNTSHSPYFLPPTRFSKPFFCNFAIMNFTPSSVILPIAFAASTLVALGLSLKYSNTFFWVVSKFFWVAISLFWVVSISSNCPFWVADSLFWVVEEVSIFCATLPLALTGAEAPSLTRPERMETPSLSRPERMETPSPSRPERMKTPSPSRPERAEAPSPGHRPGYVVCEPGALKGQKLYNITQPA